MPGVAVVTIAARNYVAHARVLARSLHRHAPGLRLHVVLADEPADTMSSAREPFEWVRATELPVPRLRRVAFAFDRRQVLSVLKPFALQLLLDRGFDACLYLDADMLALDDLEPLLEEVGRRPILLTPHLRHPPTGDQRIEGELRLLRAGTFNGGMVGVSEGETARRFLRWWGKRVVARCDDDLAGGVHYDQRWLDLAPGLFPGLHVHRDPVDDVAYWNLGERELALRGERVFVKASACRLFHFSGFDAARPDQPTAHAPEFRADGIAELYRRYGALLRDAGFDECRGAVHVWDSFDDGTPIPGVARRIFRELGRERARFPDPFASSPNAFRGWLTGPARSLPGQPRRSRLWQWVYRQRPDLQRAFPEPDGRDAQAFEAWIEEHGASEYAVPASLSGARRVAAEAS